MKLEIELDLDRIDYDAINKQVQDKVAAMDLGKAYQISAKIDSKIREVTDREVNYYLKNGNWGSLTNGARVEINDEIRNNIRELIKPHVASIFNQLPQNELNKLISELLPQVLMDMLSSNMKEMLASYYYSTQATLSQFCEDRIHDMLCR